jgi:hypothetical protein
MTLRIVAGIARAAPETGRTITEIHLRGDTQASDFRVPLPATTEATMKGCTCPPQPEWPKIAFASDCPLHQLSVLNCTLPPSHQTN